MVRHVLVLVHFAVTAQVGNHGKIAATARNFALEGLLSRVAVHVRLERAGASESLVAYLALVLLLRAGRDLGVEGTHHRLWVWWH